MNYAVKLPSASGGSGHIRLSAVEVFGLGVYPTERPNDELTEFEQYDIAGWDGYEALPIARETVIGARYFYNRLPLGFPRPAISPGADGTIGFEWRTTDGATVIVEVNHFGQLKARRIKKFLVEKIEIESPNWLAHLRSALR